MKQAQNYSLDDFLKRVAYLPVVQQMVQEENQRSNAEIHKDRTDCIAQLKVLNIREAEAKAFLDAEVLALKEAEAKIEAYRKRVAYAHQPWLDAYQKRQAAEKALNQVHGEGHVQHALYMLAMMRDACKRQIDNLSAAMNPAFFLEGRIMFRPVDPAFKVQREEKKRQLEIIEEAYAAAQLLIQCDMSPMELQQHAEALLSGVGYKPNIDPTADI